MLKGTRVRHATYGLGTVVSQGSIYRTLIIKFDWMHGGAGKTIRECELTRTGKGTFNGQKSRRNAKGHSTTSV